MFQIQQKDCSKLSFIRIQWKRTAERRSDMLKFTEQYEMVLPALESKCSEFHYFQYDTFTPKDLWQYCVKKKWRKKEVETMRLHEMVNDIMEMTASEFVAYHQVEGLKGGNWFTESGQEDLEQLLRPSNKKPTSI